MSVAGGVSRFLRKLRGLTGLAVMGGACGAVFGSVTAFVFTAVMGVSGLSPRVVLAFAINWAGVGSIAAVGVGLTLVALDAGKPIERLSPGRAAGAGALIGLLIPAAFTAAVVGGVTVGSGLVLVTLSTVALGGVVGAGLVSMARRASLPVAEASPATLPSGDSDRGA